MMRVMSLIDKCDIIMYTCQIKSNKGFTMMEFVLYAYDFGNCLGARHVCTSSSPDEIVRAARGTAFSGGLLIRTDEEGCEFTKYSRDLRCNSHYQALQTYMDEKLGKDTPEVRRLREHRAYMEKARSNPQYSPWY